MVVGLDTTTFELLVFGGATMGALGRALLPYIQKLKQAEESGTEPPGFQKKYIFTLAYSLTISLGVSLTLFSSLASTINKDATIASIMILSGLSGWGSGSVVNNVVKMASGGGVKKQ